MKPWIFAVAFAVLVGGSYVLLDVKKTESPSTSRPGAAAVSTEPEALATEPEALPPAKMGGPAPVAMPRPERPRPAGPVEDENAGSADVKGAEGRAGSGSAPSGEEILDHIETSFFADHPVASSQDVAQGLETGVRAVLPAESLVLSVECRNSLCRVETEHASLDEFQDFVQRAFLTHDSTRVSNGPVFVGLLAEPAQGEPVVAVAYVGREGALLPMPAAASTTESP